MTIFTQRKHKNVESMITVHTAHDIKIDNKEDNKKAQLTLR